MTTKKLKIEKLFAFVVEDKEGEGICGMMMPNKQWMPFIGADMERVDELMPIAQQIADHTKKHIKILEFSNYKKMGEINPKSK